MVENFVRRYARMRFAQIRVSHFTCNQGLCERERDLLWRKSCRLQLLVGFVDYCKQVFQPSWNILKHV